MIGGRKNSVEEEGSNKHIKPETAQAVWSPGRKQEARSLVWKAMQGALMRRC